MKQTAVQMVFSDLESEYPSIFNMFTQEGRDFVNHFHKYLAVEKEQHNETWDSAHQVGRFEGKGIAEDNWQTFETYWEETFKSE